MKIYVGEVNIKVPFAVLSRESAEALHRHLIDLIADDKQIHEGTPVSVTCESKEYSL